MDNVIQMWLEPVDFDGDSLVVAGEGDTRWVPIRPICASLGLADNSQRTKIEADPRYMRYDIISHDAIGREQLMFCIPLHQLNGWLFSISTRRVHPSRRAKLLKYQMECQEVLFKHFMPNGGSADELANMLDFWQNAKAEAMTTAQNDTLDLRLENLRLKTTVDELAYKVQDLEERLRERGA